MKKNIVLFASLIASLFIAGSCQKYEVTEAVDENATVSSFTVKATLAASTGEGMKTTIAVDDVLRVRFTDTEGNTLGRIQTLTNKTKTEGNTATFSSDKVAIPNDAKMAVVFLDSRSTNKINLGSSPLTADFSKQTGTLESAQSFQMIGGAADLAGEVNIDLAYTTSIVKAELSFPEGVNPPSKGTTITLAINEFEKIAIGYTPELSSYTVGNISVDAIVDTIANTATAYIAVLSEDGDLKEGTVFCEFGGVKYGCDIDGTKVKSGAPFIVKQETVALMYTYNIPDEEYVVDGVTGNKVSGSDCITVADGRITVSENKTGKLRESNVVLDNGKEYKFTQFGINEIVGSYSFKAKVFKGAAGIWAKNDASDIPVTFAESASPVTLEDAEGIQRTNNVEISGIFDPMVLDAAFDVDYDSMTAKLGLFLDTRDGSGQSVGTKYGVFFPGICQKTEQWGTPWYYNEVELGTPDYTWLWYNYDMETGTFSLKNRTDSSIPIQEITQYFDQTSRYMCGFGVILSDTNVFDHTTCGARATSGYANFFQMNPTGNIMSFTKK